MTTTIKNIKTQVPTLIIGSFSLLVGIAWNNAITALIDQYIPQNYANSKNVWAKLVYAFCLTVMFAVVMTYI